MTQENHDLSAQSNTRECAVGVEVEAQKRPKIFSAGLNDDELIEFLRETADVIYTRSSLRGKPERLRANADESEKRLAELEKIISGVVHQQN
ncbi:hypothetical protein [Pectobacterium carotovorum]|uniref:hypothetical protein n=1 Tax=Pectobacterium carotovorum TaxID=554 RepID=UPI001E300108|nr:hypothetical protein [Pectobacterium carotovorum]UFT92956.1 hypothetical protein LQF52_13915 [Pectobacterium carotovorum]